MNLQTLAHQAQQIQQAYEAGQISADEYKALVADMGLMEAINDQTSALEENLVYRQVILTAINIASTLA